MEKREKKKRKWLAGEKTLGAYMSAIKMEARKIQVC